MSCRSRRRMLLFVTLLLAPGATGVAWPAAVPFRWVLPLALLKPRALGHVLGWPWRVASSVLTRRRPEDESALVEPARGRGRLIPLSPFVTLARLPAPVPDSAMPPALSGGTLLTRRYEADVPAVARVLFGPDTGFAMAFVRAQRSKPLLARLPLKVCAPAPCCLRR